MSRMGTRLLNAANAACDTHGPHVAYLQAPAGVVPATV
jgi:hypothetical protein